MTLRKRIQVLLAFLVAVPLVILLVESYRHGHGALMEQIRSGSLHIATFQAAEMDLTFVPARQTAEGLARAMEAIQTLDPPAIRTLLRHTLDHEPDVYGVCVALQPGATAAGRLAPYAFRDGGRIRERSLHDPGYDYTRWDWFRQPLAAGRGVWSDPYFDRGGGDVLMLTYATPIRREGRLVGVATVDLSLDGLTRRLGRLHPGGEGTVYLLGRRGQDLLHPGLPPLDGSGQGTGSRTRKALKALLAHRGGDALEMTDPVSGRRSWVVETPVRAMAEDQGGRGWEVVVSWPLARHLKPVFRLAARMGLLFLFLGGGALLFLHRAFDECITQPVRRMADQARSYAAGVLPPRPTPREEAMELQDLGREIRNLGDALLRARNRNSGDPGGAP